MTIRVHMRGQSIDDGEASAVVATLAAGGIETCEESEGKDVLLWLATPRSIEVASLRELAARGLRVLVLVLPEAGSCPIPTRRWIECGASDVVEWKDDPACVARVRARLERWRDVSELLRAPATKRLAVGRSAAWRQLLVRVVEAAAFSDAPILLLGESGTGKEQLARLVHELDRRQAKRRVVTVDCAAVVPELSGSEFFGHERGAFTGAASMREGAFAEADGGTLFLDEVGELPMGLQAQLLRVVQEGTYKRVGGNGWHQSRFRLVSATNRDLPQDVHDYKFRLDFLHRIGGFTFRVPRLAERPEDIVVLARHLAACELKLPDVELDEDLQAFLVERDYPGNVRELKQLIIRTCSRHVGNRPLSLTDVPEEEIRGSLPRASGDDMATLACRAVASGTGLKELLRSTRRSAIQAALAASDRNVQRAARLLKVTDRALQLELAKTDG
jgi:transcriptional regulator with GAF, ATPase, and Fis domain